MTTSTEQNRPLPKPAFLIERPVKNLSIDQLLLDAVRDEYGSDETRLYYRGGLSLLSKKEVRLFIDGTDIPERFSMGSLGRMIVLADEVGGVKRPATRLERLNLAVSAVVHKPGDEGEDDKIVAQVVDRLGVAEAERGVYVERLERLVGSEMTLQDFELEITLAHLMDGDDVEGILASIRPEVPEAVYLDLPQPYPR